MLLTLKHGLASENEMHMHFKTFVKSSTQFPSILALFF